MEKVVIILQQFDCVEREYENRNHEMKKFASKGMLVSDGHDTMYVEVTGNKAREMGTLPTDRAYAMQLSTRVRSWQGQDGRTMWANSIEVNTLKPCDEASLRKEAGL